MARNPKKTLTRLLRYMRKYTPVLIIVLVCIFLSSFAQTMGSRSLGTLVDDYILPMVESGSQDYGPMVGYLTKIALIFALRSEEHTSELQSQNIVHLVCVLLEIGRASCRERV